MRDLIFEIKKELMEASRTKKMLALVIIAMFFALLDPVMLKMTPYLLKEFSGVDMSSIIDLSQIAELGNFHQDIYQIFTIILVIIISNIWINEIKNRTLVIPISKGVKIYNMLLAKTFSYSMITFLLMILAYSLNYYYSGIIFGFTVDYNQVLYSGLLMGMFYAWCIVLIISISTISNNFPTVVFLSLITAFGGPFIVSLVKIEAYTPFGLLSKASNYHEITKVGIWSNVLWVILTMIVIYYIGVIIARRKEIIKY